MTNKAGTIWCWLFGHKFAGWFKMPEGIGTTLVTLKQKDFCVRCGADKYPKE